jgi:phage shock protein E
MKVKYLAILAVFGLFLTGCSSAAAVKLGVEEFSQKASEPGIVVIDVRTPSEYAAGHLQGAINIDFQSGYFQEEINKLDKGVTYAVYCRSANRSGQAVKIMSDLGFTKLYDMDGGVIDWTAAGKSLYVR